MFLRHSISVLALPVVATIVVPVWLLSFDGAVNSLWPDSGPFDWTARIIGVATFLAAFSLFTWCLALFVKIGRGTLAPWDPTQQLVAVGPYRFARNPMISAVAGMLAAEAIYTGSPILVAWVILFVLINHAYFVLSEEPGLIRRFGEPYLRYMERVPRWLPKRHRQG